MTTYKSKQELEGNTLQNGDAVVLTISGTDYTMFVCTEDCDGTYLYHSTLSNTLFDKLGLNIRNFVKETVGYLFSGDFPYHKNLEDLTKTTLALFAECEKIDKPKGVVDLSIIPEWKVGDVVWFKRWYVIKNILADRSDYPIVCEYGVEGDVETFTFDGYNFLDDSSRVLLTQNEALLCFGLTPPDEILKLSAEIKAENTPELEVEEELVEVKLTKTQYDKLLNLLNE